MSDLKDIRSDLNGVSAAELLTNLREKIHQTKLLEKSNLEIEQMLQLGKNDESKELDQDDKMILSEAFNENKEAIKRKKQASQIFGDILTKKMEANELSKDLTSEVESIIKEVQRSNTEQDQIDSSATESQGIYM